MLTSHFKSYLEYNVLTTNEVADMLEISKVRISTLVKDGELTPFKQTGQGMLFLRSDIEEYVKSKKFGLKRIAPIFDHSGSTHRSVQFFEDNIKYLDSIESISIYNYELDAALDHYYLPSDFLSNGELKRVNTPYFVIRDVKGKELWLGACNCGYGGTGPHGSESILKSLGFSSDVTEKVFFNQVVKILIEPDGNYEVYAHDGKFPRFERRYEDIYASLYLFRNDLVLVTDQRDWTFIDHLRVLEKYRAFVPNPEEIIILNHNQAKDYGYITLDHFGFIQTYRFIIIDSTGRQLWLNPLIDDEKPISTQDQIRKIIEYCGIEIPDERMTDKLISWLNTNIRKIPPEPLRLRRKDRD